MCGALTTGAADAWDPRVAASPLKQRSPKCLLIVRSAQLSKRSQREGLVDSRLAFATSVVAQEESLPRCFDLPGVRGRRARGDDAITDRI